MTEDTEAGTRQYLAKIVSQTDEIDTKVMEFLRAVDDASLTYEAIDVGAFVEMLVGNLRPQLPGDVALTARIADDIPQTVVDAQEFESVLTELVRNAVAAMKGGGSISIRARSGKRPDGITRKSGHKSYVDIEIIDTGDGMDAEALSRVFESGYSTRPDGTGLGMTIARRVIEGYGGQISVRSEDGSGTIVVIKLPGV